MKILVVDDEYMFGSLLSHALKRLGHEPSVVAHPADALEVFRQEGFDAVITDIDMPDMNGVELARKLREEHDGVPIAFCTGSDPDTQAIADAKRIGEVLPKVWTIAQIKGVVEGLRVLHHDKQQRLARGSEVVIPLKSVPNEPRMVIRRRADAVPGRQMRRKIKVNCKTWNEVEKLCDKQSEGRNLLTIRGAHPLETGDRVTIALCLPDELVLSIAATVEGVRQIERDLSAYSIRLIGLTPEMCTRMRSLIQESSSSTVKPSYVRVQKQAVGSDSEIETPAEGLVLGNLRLRKQIDAIGRIGTETETKEEDLKN